MSFTETSAGPIRVSERGDGEPILFLHGVFVNGTLWDPVVERLARTHRCIVPDLPLGSHPRPMHPDADLSWRGVAGLVVELGDALGLHAPTLVTNDSGGVVGQMLALHHPDRIGRWVWTSGEAFANNPPPMFRPVVAAARVPGALAAIAASLRSAKARRLPTAYGALTLRPVDDAVLEAWTVPMRDPAIRRDLGKHLRTIDRAVTVDAATKLTAFDHPVLLAWSREDRFFPVADAHRLAALLPDARVHEIADAATYSSYDQPERLAALIADHARGTA